MDHAKEARYLLLAASGTLDPLWRRRRRRGRVSDADGMRGRRDQSRKGGRGVSETVGMEYGFYLRRSHAGQWMINLLLLKGK